MASDTGSNYFFIPGAETPAPTPVTPPPATTEPVSPFEKYLIALENLQAPVELPVSSYQQPAAPAFTPMAAPTAVRVTPPTQFGPVTASGYAQPPVDPLSYYSAPEPVAQSIPNPNAPTRWFYFKTSTPDLSITQSVAQPEQPTPNLSNPKTLNQEKLNPVAEKLGTSAITIMDPNTGLPIEVVANPDFVEPRVVPNPPRGNLPPIPPGMLDPVMDYDQWKYVDRYIKKPDKPATPKEDENVKYLTPEEVEQLLGGQTPLPPVPPQEDVPMLPPGAPPTPGLPTIVEPPKTPFTFTQRPVIQPPPTRVEAVPYQRKPIINPLIEPTTIPVATRRMIEDISPGYFKDINYDPDEILAAAMRVLRGRGAGRSLME